MGTEDKELKNDLFVLAKTKGDPLAPEEIKKFLKLARELVTQQTDTRAKRLKNLRNALLIRLLALTGRRIGEILSIRVKDIDFEQRIINTVIEKRRIRRKSKVGEEKIIKTRPISFDFDTHQLMLQYIELKQLKKNDLLFGISERQAERIVKALAKQLNLEKNITPHSFRHGLITYLRKLGWSSDDIKKVTGHAKAETIDRAYDHATFFDVQEKFEKGISKLFED